MKHAPWALVFCAAVALADPPTMFPPVRGTHDMVGAANNLEVEAGYRILEKGGNAVDAGVATVLAAAVTEQSRFGLGGEMPLLIKMAGKPRWSLSAASAWRPRKATVDYYTHRPPEPWEDPSRKPPVPMQGIKAAITPGVFDGLMLALQKYGTMTFAEVAQPAIDYAEGFPIAEEFAEMLQNYKRILDVWPASQAFFYPNGAPPNRGDLVRMARARQDAARTGGRRKEGTRQSRQEDPRRPRSVLSGLHRQAHRRVFRSQRRTDRL